MQDWDKALLDACDRYPNMRIYDWASDVKDNWFIDDGIHFTSQGYAERGPADRRRAAGSLPRLAEIKRRLRSASSIRTPPRLPNRSIHGG